MDAVFTQTSPDLMTVVELDTNRATVNVSDGPGHRYIWFFHFASAVASAHAN